ncbi:MAG: trypsin-like peptidase domain-containing protein [Thaumarchaeota archaeon]|nr:trypsin-like peptidase domain-containing protein [Nitrososphaerota archaeon]
MTNTEGVGLLQSFSDAVAGLAESVSPSVVNVNAGRRGGTGLVWSSDGLVVTANHVIGRSAAPTVTLGDGRELQAKVLGADHYTDIALLKVEAGGLKPIEHGTTGDLKVGQFVLALANAFGRKVSATSGIVTSNTRSMRGWWGAMIESAVVTDAKLNPGYSGGPLVDASGKLLGMNVAYFSGRGVAVSVDSLSETVSKLSKDGRVKKGYLGIVVEGIELPEEIAKLPDVGQDEALLVRAVEAQTPARQAGVSIGDIIVRLGDTKATDEYELHKALSSEVVGKQVSLWVLRGGRLTELKVTPAEVGE